MVLWIEKEGWDLRSIERVEATGYGNGIYVRAEGKTMETSTTVNYVKSYMSWKTKDKREEWLWGCCIRIAYETATASTGNYVVI